MIKNAELSLVVGRRGSGKSTKVKSMIAHKSRVIVFDPQDEYSEAGFTHGKTGDLLRAYLAERWDGEFRAAYVPPANRETMALDVLAKFILQIQEPYRADQDDRQITLVIEEMNLGYPVQALPAHLDGMARICNQGRHYGVNVIGVTQRPALVSTTFRGNISEAFIFPLSWGEDKGAMLQMLGREHADQLNQLLDYHCLHWRNGQVIQEGNH